MTVAIGGEDQRPLIDSRAAALAYAEECGLAATPDRYLLMLLSATSRLLSSKQLSAASMEHLDSGHILRAARAADASGFLLLTTAPAAHSPRLRTQLLRLGTTCREFGVDFIDCLHLSGRGARSLMWDVPVPPPEPPNPWAPH